ncbi:MAG TPA: glycoside hydrolase family 15 protein [Anaerolineae bacterium]|nr:glycoside hydrolase family 15 protein [Anaerolineae bacterium]
MSDLYQHSIQVILTNQAASGAYVATPDFPPYRYCWFRDSSFTAYAMDLVGQHKSARAFHNWAAAVITAREATVARAVARANQGLSLAPGDYLHTRYRLDGQAENDDWPNFQLDGFGTWLWALAQHVRLSQLRTLPSLWARAVELITQYLMALWPHPNYDLWEEHGDRIHPYTLSALFAGLRAAAALLGRDEWRSAAVDIRAFVLEHGVAEGHLAKSLGDAAVDASLLGVATPYRLLEPGDPVMRATVAEIERTLRRGGGGVHRYAADTYYGGGEWILLTAWLGWYYVDIGRPMQAHPLLAWIEAQADAAGDLPEQVPVTLNTPETYDLWVERWGPIARPLLWSHAKYLILRHGLDSLSMSGE